MHNKYRLLDFSSRRRNQLRQIEFLNCNWLRPNKFWLKKTILICFKLSEYGSGSVTVISLFTLSTFYAWNVKNGYIYGMCDKPMV